MKRREGNFVLDRCVPAANGCMEWIGARSTSTHGNAWFEGRPIGAHRLSLMLHSGLTRDQIGDSFVCHRCDNPPCCNPDHLYWGDMATNMQDAYARGQKSRMQGEDRKNHVLKEDEVRAIRAKLSNGIPKAAIAREYSVSHSAIMHIFKGRSWSHLS